MAKRSDKKKYIKKEDVVQRTAPPTLTEVIIRLPSIVAKFDKSMVKQAQAKPDWKLYKVELRNNVPYIVREMCDRCGKVYIPPAWRKLRRHVDPELGEIYLETGICKDCINASVYVDKYLDGVPLGEVDAKEEYMRLAREYEKAWRLVLTFAPPTLITNEEWRKVCKFFGGCSKCAGPIELQAKFFPSLLNGTHSAWNVLPMCESCYKIHMHGRSKKEGVHRYKVFSTKESFNKLKTTRMYLAQQMVRHNVYMEPIIPFRKRFFETKVLEGSE